MLQRDLDFAIWCARRCLHLWNAPSEVKEWLAKPRPEAAGAWAAEWAAQAAAQVAAQAAQAAQAEERAAERAAQAAADAADAAAQAAAQAAADAAEAAWAAEAAAWAAAQAAQAVARAAQAAAQALDVPLGQLRLDYVVDWTDDELSHAKGDWIEPATVEIFDRMARHAAT